MTDVMKEKIYNDKFELMKHSLGEIEKGTDGSKLRLHEENKLLISAVQQTVMEELERNLKDYEEKNPSRDSEDVDFSHLKINLNITKYINESIISHSKRVLALPESVYEVYVETGKILTSTETEPFQYEDRSDYEKLEEHVHHTYDKELRDYAKLSLQEEEEPLTSLDTDTIRKAVEDVLTTSEATKEKITLGEATSHIMENYLQQKEKQNDIVSFGDAAKQEGLTEEEPKGPLIMKKDIQAKEMDKIKEAEEDEAEELTFVTDEKSFETQTFSLKTLDELESYLLEKKEEFAQCQRALDEARKTYQESIEELESAKEAAEKAKQTAEETEKLVDEASERLVLYQNIEMLEKNTREAIEETDDLNADSKQAQLETQKYLEDNEVYGEQISNNKQKLQNLSVRLEAFQQPQPTVTSEIVHQVELPDEAPVKGLKK